MKKYLYLFRGGDARMAEMTNEDRQKHMEDWVKWMKELGKAGNLVDGLPLSEEGKQVKERGKVIHDGPYPEGKEIVGGYLIVNASNIDHAVEISRDCPIFDTGGEVEVREIMDMDM